MSLSSYEIFDMVVKQKSFVRASEHLNLTPSAVSRSILSLEEITGFPLFIRNKNGVELTSYGEELVPLIKTILCDVENLNQIISKLNGLDKGSLRIGTINSVCVNWLPGIMKSFSAIYPNINIEIFQGDYKNVSDWLKSNQIDIGLTSLSYPVDFPSTPIYKDKMLCIVPKGFKPLNIEHVTIEDLRNQNFVYYRKGSDAEIKQFVTKYKLTVNSQFHIVDDQSVVAMVESGFGISITPELALDKLNINVDFYEIFPQEFRIIGMIYLNMKLLSPAAKTFYDFVMSYLEENGIKNV